MRAYASLWSVDLLAIRNAVRLVERDVDGFHIDVFDGHNVPELLFGPDLVAALQGTTDALLDVHLNVDDPDYWARRFIDAGATMITVQPSACTNVGRTLRRISEQGAKPGLGLEISDPTAIVADHAQVIDRILVMGTELAVKGAELDSRTFDRVRALRKSLQRADRQPEIVVDGGIRRHTVAKLAAAGADGVVPGSLVFGDADPCGAVRWIHSLGAD